MRREPVVRPSAVLVAAVTWAMGGASCSSKSDAGAPSASVASTSAATSKPSASIAPIASAPKPPPKPALKCPDDYYWSEDPVYCVKLAQARPGRGEVDGPWVTAQIGAMASLSVSKTQSVEQTVKDVRDKWGTDALKDRTKYQEEATSSRTTVRYLSFDPNEDPKALQAKSVTIVVGKSGDTTIRCEVYGDMSSPEVCTSLLLPE